MPLTLLDLSLTMSLGTRRVRVTVEGETVAIRYNDETLDYPAECVREVSAALVRAFWLTESETRGPQANLVSALITLARIACGVALVGVGFGGLSADGRDHLSRVQRATEAAAKKAFPVPTARRW